MHKTSTRLARQRIAPSNRPGGGSLNRVFVEELCVILRPNTTGKTANFLAITAKGNAQGAVDRAAH
jgi:hypothetical protein